jgi:hypothetical protein
MVQVLIVFKPNHDIDKRIAHSEDLFHTFLFLKDGKGIKIFQEE